MPSGAAACYMLSISKPELMVISLVDMALARSIDLNLQSHNSWLHGLHE
jgi:hypothetical protein